jgi:hypothetical protein
MTGNESLQALEELPEVDLIGFEWWDPSLELQPGLLGIQL